MADRARLQIDERCARTGYCTRIAPDVFVLEEDAETVSVRNVRIDDDQTPEGFEAVLEAEGTCPLAAIMVIEDAD